MHEVKKPKKPMIFYYLIVIGVLLLLNTFLFPRLLSQEVREVDYGTFLGMLDDKEVKVAQVEQDYIYFTADTPEEGTLYRTATFNDPSLVDRL